MHPDYSMLSEEGRTLAFIGEYAQAFEDYMKRTARRWAGDPLKSLDVEYPKTFEFWDACDGMRKVCDVTETHYGDFWRSAFEIVFSWDMPYPTPIFFYSKRGEDRPNTEFLVQIIKGIEKREVVTSTSPHYLPQNYVGSVQQREYFGGLKKKLTEMGREDAWQRMAERGLIPKEVI